MLARALIMALGTKDGESAMIPVQIGGDVVRIILLVVAVFQLEGLTVALAWEWVPSEQEIKKYRQSWNPFSHGPMLIQPVDIQPKGQSSIRYFIFSQVGEHSYGNQINLFTERRNGPVHLYAVAPSASYTYGLTDHIELGASASLNAFWARDSVGFDQGRGGPLKTNTGLGDTNLFLKHRFIVQDPDTWRPSLTFQHMVTLPTSRWITDTQRPPGGFAPLGRFPATRFGEIGLTEGLMVRKNVHPFRISSGVFYTYSAPGSDGPVTTYTPDVVNTRLAFEHLLDDEKGFGYNLEFVGLHGLTWRADGHALNRGKPNGFNILGVEPAIQYRLGEHLVFSAGVLFTLAGQNAIDSMYPNFSLFWYWSDNGKVIMR